MSTIQNVPLRFSTPLVTVVTPAYNAASFIADTLESVRAQTFCDWEHIVVDDCSRDGTVDLLRAYAAKDSRVKVLLQTKNMGAGAARNRAIEEATGRYLAFLDSDDLWLPDKLERQIAFMRTHDVPLSYTNFTRINAQTGRVVGHVRSPDRIDYHDLLRSCQIGCSTAIYDTASAGKVFMPLIRKRQDWGLWLRIAREGVVGRNIGLDLAVYRVRPDSISANKWSAMLYTWRFYRDVAGLRMPERVWRTGMYAVINTRKYLAARRAKSRVML